MHWGVSSREYISFHQDEEFIVIGVSAGDIDAGWAWVVRPICISGGGWVSALFLSDPIAYVFYEDFPWGQLEPLETELAYVLPNLRLGDLARIAPDGTDLARYTSLAVCHLDVGRVN